MKPLTAKPIINRRKPRVNHKRHTYSLDVDTLADLGYLQAALRASSATETVKQCIRRYASLVRHVEDGYEVGLHHPMKPSTLFDVPGKAY